MCRVVAIAALVILALLSGSPLALSAQQPSLSERGLTAAAATGGDGAADPLADVWHQASVPPALRAARSAGAPPAIDGRMDEEVWNLAAIATGFTQSRPQAGAPATERTEARILYDNHAIYIGVRLFDSRPDSVVARLGRRDESLYSDWVSVQLDSNHDRRTAFSFGVNPRGVKRDALLYDDTRSDGNWNAVWEAAASIDSLGWTAEFRIPLSQLRFSLPRDSTTEMRWGINIDRSLARREEASSWSPIPPNAGRHVSLFGELHGLEGLRPPRRLEVLPYSAARLTRAPRDVASPFYRRNDFFHSAGADLSYGVTSSLTLTATLNPDFGQVEADPSVVNLTAYETFFAEKRPFFIEGREILRFGIDDTQLLYSRRIGRAPQRVVAVPGGFADAPAATTVLGAAKLSGRTVGGWSVSVLGALTAREEAQVADSAGGRGTVAVEPLTSYAVARLSRDFGQGRSSVGGIFTATRRWLEEADGLGFLRDAAYAGGLDSRIRMGNHELTGYLLGSYVQGSTRAMERTQRAAGRYFQRPDASHLRLDPDRTSLSGQSASLSFGRVSGGHWTWGVSGHAVSPGFEVNDLGYQRVTDAMSQSFFVNYNQYDPGRIFRSWNLTLSEWARWNFGRERLATGISTDLGFQLMNYWGGNVGMSRAFAGLATDALWGGPAIATPARSDAWFSLYGDTRRTLSVQLYGNAAQEDGTGGRSLGMGSSLTLRPSSRLELSLSPYLAWNTDAWLFMAEHLVHGAPYYLFGRVDQTTASLTGRVNLTFSPTLSLQFHAAPFVGAGEYSELKVVRELRAGRFTDRFHIFAADEVRSDADSHSFVLDLNADGEEDAWLWNPEFNSRALNSNMVLRWEYRRGSTLFVVWSQGRSDWVNDGAFHPGRDFGQLLGVRGGRDLPVTNVLVVKLNYWLGM
jgi:hypothetical protein